MQAYGIAEHRSRSKAQSAIRRCKANSMDIRRKVNGRSRNNQAWAAKQWMAQPQKRSTTKNVWRSRHARDPLRKCTAADEPNAGTSITEVKGDASRRNRQATQIAPCEGSA